VKVVAVSVCVGIDMFRTRLLLIQSMVLLLAGCTSTYTENRGEDFGVQLDVARGVYIITPADGSYGDIDYTGSGEMAAASVEIEFSKFASRVSLSDACELEACLEALKGSDYGYLVEPKILHWEDRSTEWSGKPDRISIKLSIYDISSDERLSQVILEGKSKWATLGGDHPQDLLPEPIGKYVASLYD